MAALGLHCFCSGFVLLPWVGTTLCCGARTSRWSGFSCHRAQALGTWVSLVVALRLGSCDSQAWLLQDMWSVPGPGIEPLLPASAGRFLSTIPPGSLRPLVFKPAWFVSLPGKIFQCNSLKCACLFIYNWYIMKHIIYLYQWCTSMAAVTVWPRGATPHPRSGAAAERSYPTTKVRSRSYSLLERLWRDTPRLR